MKSRAVLLVHRPAWADGMEWGEAAAEGPHMLMILLFFTTQDGYRGAI